MRCRSGQNGDEMAKAVEYCKNHGVLQEPSSSVCKNRRVLQNPSSSARTVELCQQEPSSYVSKNRRVLQNPSRSTKPVEQDSTGSVLWASIHCNKAVEVGTNHYSNKRWH
ncbi:hypothetical protein LSAT2_009506 [Lamellibrachia satsuma]|nr:hypothetical protein LSAT2_009506 [Lamellibrachia satsuma]